MKLNVLVVDDNPIRLSRVEDVLKELEVEEVYKCSDLESAIELLEKKEIKGIVTDMQFPISKDSSEVKDRAGICLIEWLQEKEKVIPVLGNSHCEFPTEYPAYKGRMLGFVDFPIIEKFISSIKGHHD